MFDTEFTELINRLRTNRRYLVSHPKSQDQSTLLCRVIRVIDTGLTFRDNVYKYYYRKIMHIQGNV